MAKRLNLIKVAEDLDVGISTLVEHLRKHNIDIENSPRAEVSEQAYAILEGQFRIKRRKQKISIKNFGAVQDADIEVKKILVLI